MILDAPLPIHTKNITNNTALQMIIEVPLTYVHTMEQTTTTLTMINLAQQIFLFLVCLLTFLCRYKVSFCQVW